MLRRTVVKFGGTSVKTAHAINKVIDIIENNHTIRVVVVSALAGVTNKLVQFCHASCEQRQTILSEIKCIHLDILKDLNLFNQLSQEIIEIINKWDEYCSFELKTDHIDDILSLGEQLSSLIIYHVLKQNNHIVALVDAKKMIITDDHFGKALPQLNLIKEHCQDLIENLPENMVVVTQGFIGATVEGRTTTLGRGGSDFTAALIAQAINANILHIYTDVKGVYTMDPNVIENAELIECLSFQEMAELANFGAKVLHPATLAPCVLSNIPVMIASTFEPSQGGTRIVPDEHVNRKKSSVIRAIAMRKKQILVIIKSLNMLNACGFLANVFSILARHKISVDLITTSEVSIALTIDGSNFGSHEINPFTDQCVLDDLKSFSDVSLEENLALVTVVGEGLTISGVSQNILAKIVDYSIRLICYGASSSNIGFLVPSCDLVSIVTTLHQEFIETRDRKG